MARIKKLQETIEKIEERRASLPPVKEIRIWMDGVFPCDFKKLDNHPYCRSAYIRHHDSILKLWVLLVAIAKRFVLN